ncbi:MAG: PEP/pyruvate-binding domain-containing protein [Thermodesulfobacteriota bacterium]
MKELISSLWNRIGPLMGFREAPSGKAVSRVFKFRYNCFKDLLASNAELLNIITDFEVKLRGQTVFGMSYVRSQTTRAIFHTLRMVKSLDDLSNHRYPLLFDVVDRINQAVEEELGRKKELPVSEVVLPYSGITREMADWVGGKSANLGELLNKARIPIPEGFAITTRAYELFLEENHLVDEINRIRQDLDPENPEAINSASEGIQRLIISSQVPHALQVAIFSAYEQMAEAIGIRRGDKPSRPPVALRSSAIGEDSDLSFAGQYLSILNVPYERIVETYKLILASLFTPRAISYRLNKGIRDEDIAMSVACLEMVKSRASGVMYTRDPSNPLDEAILITAVWGLGPYAVDGIITPDTYVVSKDNHFRIKRTVVSHKPVQLLAAPEGGLHEEAVEEGSQDSACLAPDQVRTLAGYGLSLENHYNYPQDIEWAVDAFGRVLILQTRPLHLEEIQRNGLKSLPTVQGHELLLEGAAIASPGVGCGPAIHVRSDEDLQRFPRGGVLVAKHSSPQFVIVMQKAEAIVTDAGSVTGHMASLAREFGIPTILGTRVATGKIAPNTEITVDAYSGRVYLGRVPELLALRRTKESPMKATPIYETLRRVADWIVPLDLVNPRAANFAPEYCRTLHDVMRLVHELSYQEMFQISDLVSDTTGAGALKLVAPIPLDLYIIDLGDGLQGVSPSARRITVDEIACVPLAALLKGMLNEDLREQGPRPVHLGGFLSVMREQMLSPVNVADRFGDRSYAIISDKYLNFSSRIGYHYSVLDSYCCETVNKNYITFSFKGGAADEVRRNRRARALALILEGLQFEVEVREDRVDAHYNKYEESVTIEKLDMVGRMLQYSRQMDMLMQSEASVGIFAETFLSGKYNFDTEFLAQLAKGKN